MFAVPAPQDLNLKIATAKKFCDFAAQVFSTRLNDQQQSFVENKQFLISFWLFIICRSLSLAPVSHNLIIIILALGYFYNE